MYDRFQEEGQVNMSEGQHVKDKQAILQLPIYKSVIGERICSFVGSCNKDGTNTGSRVVAATMKREHGLELITKKEGGFPSSGLVRSGDHMPKAIRPITALWRDDAGETLTSFLFLSHPVPTRRVGMG